MPKDLKEFENLAENSGREGGRRVDWEDIAKKIIARSRYFSAKEVWEDKDMVDKKVTLFRTKNALDDLAKKTKKRPKMLDRRYGENKFWYGPIIKGVKVIE